MRRSARDSGGRGSLSLITSKREVDEIEGAEPPASPTDRACSDFRAIAQLRELLRGQFTVPALKLNQPLVVKVCLSIEGNASVYLVEFSGSSVGARGCKAIAESLAKNTTCVILNMSNCFIGREGFLYIGRLLESTSRLHTLNLHNTDIRLSGARFLASGLRKNKSLTALHLSGEQTMESESLRVLSDAFAQSELKHLSIRWISTFGGAVSLPFWAWMRSASCRLETLFLDWIALSTEECDQLARALQVQHIYNEKKHNMIFLEELPEDNIPRTLQRLEWTSAGSLHGREWGKLATALKLNSTLRVLHLAGSPFSSTAESNYNPQLRDFASLLEINHTLREVRFDICAQQSEDEVAQQLAALVERCTLHTLAITGLTEGMLRSGKLAQSIASQTHIRFWDFSPSWSLRTAAPQLIDALSKNSFGNLTYLNLSSISQSAAYGTAVAELIRTSKTLLSLTLGSMLPRQRELANSGLQTLFGALLQNRVLRRLSMAEEWQAVDLDILVRWLTRLIESTSTLRTLVFSVAGEPRPPRTVEMDLTAMMLALQRNQSIVYLCVAAPYNHPPDIKRRIERLQASRNISVLFRDDPLFEDPMLGCEEQFTGGAVAGLKYLCLRYLCTHKRQFYAKLGRLPRDLMEQLREYDRRLDLETRSEKMALVARAQQEGSGSWLFGSSGSSGGSGSAIGMSHSSGEISQSASPVVQTRNRRASSDAGAIWSDEKVDAACTIL